MTKIFFVCSFLFVEVCSGQETNVSLKIGASKLLNSPCNFENAYKLSAPFWVYPNLQLELKKEDIFGDGKDFLGGISFIPTFSDLSLNEEHFQSGASRSLRVTTYSFQVYAGFQRNFKKSKSPVYKNYLSVAGGVGLNLSGGNLYKPVYFTDYGVTKQGEIFEGTYYTIEKGFYLSPIFICAIRYNITNNKGRDVVSLELMSNYNLLRYYSHTLRYKVNGDSRTEFLSEKGFQIQLNVIIPLFDFKKQVRK